MVTPAISRDGQYAFFLSTEPIFEDDEDYPWDVYSVALATGAIDRFSGLRTIDPVFFPADRPAVDQGGHRVAFQALGDFQDANPDMISELFLADRLAPASIQVGRAAPTLVSWTPEPTPVRYDVIRGDAANLAFSGSTVNLGPVACLEDDSRDKDTAGFEDAAQPAQGHVFFYLYRGAQAQGPSMGPGTFGFSSDGRERIGGAGVCGP